jgi:hypothetical protein
MNRAYSILTVKSVDENKRVIRGVATTPETDRQGDIVESLGVVYKNPLPLLWMHQHRQTGRFGKIRQADQERDQLRSHSSERRPSLERSRTE